MKLDSLVNENVLLFDMNYILGRDNYSCIFCNKQLNFEDIYIIKLDENLDFNSNNLVVCCKEKKCSDGHDANLPKTSFTGRLIVIASCMFAEKTTITKSLVNKYSRILGKYIWVKPDIDIRGVGVTTHNGEEINAKTISHIRPDAHLVELSSYSIIAFDEIQFFNNRILYVINQLLKSNKIVIVNGLKLDYKRNIFGNVHLFACRS